MSKANGMNSLVNGMDNKSKTKYVQFSKRVVSIVLFVVSLICFLGMMLCYQYQDSNGMVNMVSKFIDFAMVVFVSYSVNSISEKAITKYMAKTDEEETSGNG